ncbi:MAG: efflux RND transporter permease subunit [Undibacterium sp.]|nr:efflux RND transporter permease subunit [Undibacterium sp.]
MKNSTFNKLERFVEFCIRRRLAVSGIFFLLTVLMAISAFRVNVKTAFEDLLPTNHPYVQVHEKFQQGFGGSNVVSIMLSVDKGDIFTPEVLGEIKKVTTSLEQVEGVNPFQIISLASKKLREVKASTDSIETKPVMWPDVPKSKEALDALKTSVLNNALIYGAYVSKDLKAALITVDFYEGSVDYKKIFPQVMAIADAAKGKGISVNVVGEPILYGWVNKYLPETLEIFVLTVACLVSLLFVVARTWRGTLLPLLAGTSSAIWALGSASLIGYNLDPLVIVIAFLITARAISHSVQLVSRFDDELLNGASDSVAAAKAAMLQLFKPGMLGVVADAGCMIVVILTPIPLMQKVSVIGTIWVSTIAVSACIMTPVLLSWLPSKQKFAHSIDVSPVLNTILNFCISVAISRWRYTVLSIAAVLFIVSCFEAFKLKVGDADSGSPILWQDSAYNTDSAEINKQFQGSDRMYVVFSGKAPDAVKEPAVLENMKSMQKFMANQPEIGGSLSIADVIPPVRKLLRENNPRYEEFGLNKSENGELIYMFKSGTEPGDMERFSDNAYQNAPVNFYFKDHQGESVRTAISRLKEFVANNPLEQGTYLLAGGLIGVVAAVNEVILAGQIESIALALLVLVLCCAVAYRSTTAGIFFMVPVILSNTVTFAYMAWNGIGMNLSTLPVAALGIGLGVDYAFYVVDGIKEELHHHSDLKRAITQSLLSAGKGVLITAATLTACVVLWFGSSLRFQADMGILMAIWLGISAISALLLMPAMVYVFKPDFIIGTKPEA